MAFLTITEVKAKTDRYAGVYDALAAALPGLLAKMQADVTAIYGDGTTAHLPLSDPNAINALGPPAIKSAAVLASPALYSAALAADIAALSSYLLKNGGLPAGLPASVKDAASYLRYSSGCADPSPAGSGAGSTYAHLAHPSYAALVSLLSGGGSVLPPDTVFAPTGIVLGRFHVTGGFGAGQALMTKGVSPYAPAGPAQFVVRCGNAAGLNAAGLNPAGGAGTLTGTAPNGSLLLVVTGKNQAGVSVTWRGDCGTGLTALGQTLPASALQGTAGGSFGGTAAPTDRLVQITGIVLDGAVSSTATQGDIDIVTVGERASL